MHWIDGLHYADYGDAHAVMSKLIMIFALCNDASELWVLMLKKFDFRIYSKLFVTQWTLNKYEILTFARKTCSVPKFRMASNVCNIQTNERTPSYSLHFDFSIN